MIRPTEADIGRKVVYRAHPNALPEEGTITSINSAYVFVRYGADQSGKATARSDLEWSTPSTSQEASR